MKDTVSLNVCSVQQEGWEVVVGQLFSRVQLFVTPWTAVRQASLSFSQTLLKVH